VTVVTVTDISVASDGGSSDDDTDTTATVTMRVPREEINDPDDTVILHETPDGWERLETTVESTTDEEVSLAADTTFSLFAVAEVDDAGDDTTTATKETENERAATDASDDAGTISDGIPGFGITISLVVLLSAVAIAVWRGQ
jgi:PGF-CTERM protein